jgi:hypothetical protein
MKQTRKLYQDADDRNDADAELKADRQYDLHAMYCPECGGDGGGKRDGLPAAQCSRCNGSGTVLST